MLNQKNKTSLRGMILSVVLALLFLFWGLFAFFTIGDKGPPTWDFGVIEDIPGQSPYSTKHPGEKFPG